jgi:hypothetical protein
VFEAIPHTLATVRAERRIQFQLVGLPALTLALVFVGRVWGRIWFLHESCALTGCQPASMAAIGWATQAGIPVFGLIAISGHRQTRVGRRLLWTGAALVGVPGLVFLPDRNDRWLDLTFNGSGGPRAFGIGLTAAWLALISLVPVLLVVLWFEDRAYLRARRQPSVAITPGGSRSIKMATRFLIGYTTAAAVMALTTAEVLVAR